MTETPPPDVPLAPLPAASAPHPATTAGLLAGAIAAATLIGELLGLGHRNGTLWRPLNAAAHTLIGARADGVWDFAPIVTPAGGLVVLALSAVAGVVTARLASSGRAPRLVGAAAGVALLGYLLHVRVAARTPGGLAALLSVGELRALYLSLAISLVAGMRFAFSPRVRDR